MPLLRAVVWTDLCHVFCQLQKRRKPFERHLQLLVHPRLELHARGDPRGRLWMHRMRQLVVGRQVPDVRIQWLFGGWSASAVECDRVLLWLPRGLRTGVPGKPVRFTHPPPTRILLQR